MSSRAQVDRITEQAVSRFDCDPNGHRMDRPQSLALRRIIKQALFSALTQAARDERSGRARRTR